MRIVTVFILYCISAFACALCALYTPTAHVTMQFQTQDNKIEKIDIKWLFSENFTNTVMQGYDLDGDNKLDKDELSQVYMAFMNYLAPRDFVTQISYYDDDNSTLKPLNFKVSNVSTFVKDKRLYLTYSLKTDIPLKENRVLKVNMYDPEGYFNFTILPQKFSKISPNFYIQDNPNQNVSYYKITKFKLLTKHIKLQNSQVNEQDSQKSNIISRFLTNMTLDFLVKIKQAISSKNPSFLTLAFIFFISYAYGFFHAAAPGHGKLLTGMYFTANGGSYIKAFWFAIKIGFIHIVGAFTLVGLSMVLIEHFTKTTTDIANITIKIAAVIIIIAALFMIYNRVKNIFFKPRFKFSTHSHSCGCVSCMSLNGVSKKNMAIKEWLIILAASIIPCPGMVIVFVIAFNLGSYFIAILCGIAISLGMASVIFISAIFGMQVNDKLSKRFSKFYKFVELGALGVMMLLGFIMLFSPIKNAVL